MRILSAQWEKHHQLPGKGIPMVIKVTPKGGSRTRAIPVEKTTVDPCDAFRQEVGEILRSFGSEAVTPQRFLELENALKAVADEACRQILEREANRLEGDDKSAVPRK